MHAKAEHKEEIVYADISELALLVHDSVHAGASDRYGGVLQCSVSSACNALITWLALPLAHGLCIVTFICLTMC